MSARVPVTVVRNDVRPEGFKSWTVYVGHVAAFDIEAQAIGGSALVHVLDADQNAIASFDGRAYGEAAR